MTLFARQEQIFMHSRARDIILVTTQNLLLRWIFGRLDNNRLPYHFYEFIVFVLQKLESLWSSRCPRNVYKIHRTKWNGKVYLDMTFVKVVYFQNFQQNILVHTKLSAQNYL